MSSNAQCPSCSQPLDADTSVCPSCDATIAMPAAAAERTEIAGYRILRTIGQGGMGRVYLAEDPALGRKVAIKVISGESRSADLRARFVREARSMATVEHPHIVRIYSFGELDDNAYIVMEYVDGDMLATRIARGPLTVREALRITRQIVDALEAAWEQHIVHRDIKPSNVLIDRRNNVRVADFGLAKPVHVVSTESSLTQDGYMLGSPHYVSPEQARGAEADFRADIYSAGIVLYEMLTGERPYGGTTPFAIVAKHLHEPLPDVRARRDDIPQAVGDLVAWMTAKDPQQRPVSYGELLAAIDDLQTGTTATVRTTKIPSHGKSTRSPVAAIAIAFAAVVAIIAGVLFTRTGSAPIPPEPPPAVPRGLVIAVSPFYGPDEDSAKEGRVMAALIERAIIQRLGRNNVRLIPMRETGEALQSEEAARALARRLGATVVIWGEAFSLRGETEIQPYFTLNLPPARPPAADDKPSAAAALGGVDTGDRRGDEFVVAAQGGNQIALRKTNANGISDLVVMFAGMFALREGNATRALELLDQAPANPETLRTRALALAQLGRLDEALPSARAAVAAEPKRGESQMLLAEIAVSAERWSEAATAYASANALTPGLRTMRGFVDAGLLYAIESYRSQNITAGKMVDTDYLLARDPATGRVVERHFLPGIPQSFVRTKKGVEVTYRTGRGADEQTLMFANGKFDRPLFPPVRLLWAMRSMKAGWWRAANFMSQTPSTTWIARPKFMPDREPKPDVPNTYEALDSSLRAAIDEDPTQPWHRFFYGTSLAAQGRAADAEAEWGRLFATDYAGTPPMEFGWMARIAEHLGHRSVADRAFAVALAKRRAQPAPIRWHFFIEPLIEAPYVRAAARASVEGPNDPARAYVWVQRGRAYSGAGIEGNDLQAAAWSRYFAARGDTASAARENAIFETARRSPMNLLMLTSRIDIATFAWIVTLASFLLLVITVLRRNDRAARGMRVPRRLPRVAVTTFIALAVSAAAWGLMALIVAPTMALAVSGGTAFVFGVAALGAFARWRNVPLNVLAGSATRSERIALAAAASLLIGAIVADWYYIHRYAGATSVPIGAVRSIGHAATVADLELRAQKRDTPGTRYLAAVANHYAGNRDRALALYDTVDDPRARASREALASGSLVPAQPPSPEDYARAFSSGSWIDVPNREHLLPPSHASAILPAIALLALLFAIVFILAPQAARGPVAHPGPFARAISLFVPGLGDLMTGNAARGYFVFAAALFAALASWMRLVLEQPTIGPYGALQLPSLISALPFPIANTGSVEAVWSDMHWKLLAAYPGAIAFYAVAIAAFLFAAGMHVRMLARRIAERSPSEKTLVYEAAQP